MRGKLGAAAAAWEGRAGEQDRGAGHRNDLQGLRAVAVLLVALSHARVGFLKGGFVGVDVFFVLSGYLITGLLLKEARVGDGSLAEFYRRRARRILPAATLTLIATTIAAYQLLNFVRAKQVIWDSIWATFFAANVHFAQQGTDYFARAQPPSPLQHFWTLAVEEQFYVVWPAVLLAIVGGRLLRRRRRGIRNWFPVLLAVACVVSMASLAWSIHARGSVDSYFSTFARAWELGVGAILAIAATKWSIPRASAAAVGWVGLAAIVAAGVFYSSTTPFPGYAALLPVLGTAAVIAAGAVSVGRLTAGRLLSLGPLSYVGDRSYTLYLWHWPFLILAYEHQGHQLSVGNNLLLLAAAFALSIVTYRFYENPIRRTEWSAGASAFSFTASIALVILVATFALNRISAHEDRLAAQAAPRTPSVGQSAPNSSKIVQDVIKSLQNQTAGDLPAVVASVDAAHTDALIPTGLSPSIGSLTSDHYSFPAGCEAHDGQTSSGVCRFGSGQKLVALVGDSHAQMWMPTVAALAHDAGWVVTPLVKTGCSPALWSGYRGNRECQAWYHWATGELQALHPDLTLVGGSYTGWAADVTPVAVSGVRSLATTARAASKSVAIISDPPGVNQQPVDCLLSNGATMKRCTTVWPPGRTTVDSQSATELSSIPGVAFIDTSGWFCIGAECPMVIGHVIAYEDTGHITQTYAASLARPFMSALQSALKDSKKR